MSGWRLLVMLALLGGLYRPEAHFVLLYEGVGGGIAPEPIHSELLAVEQGGGWDVYWKELQGDGKSYLCHHRRVGALEGLESDLEHLGLFQLPLLGEQEYDDIYRRQTGLEVHLPQHDWSFRPPVGCIRNEARSQPTPGQRAVFEQCVARVRKLAVQGSVCEVGEMDGTYRSLLKR